MIAKKSSRIQRDSLQNPVKTKGPLRSPINDNPSHKPSPNGAKRSRAPKSNRISQTGSLPRITSIPYNRINLRTHSKRITRPLLPNPIFSSRNSSSSNSNSINKYYRLRRSILKEDRQRVKLLFRRTPSHKIPLTSGQQFLPLRVLQGRSKIRFSRVSNERRSRTLRRKIRSLARTRLSRKLRLKPILSSRLQDHKYRPGH